MENPATDSNIIACPPCGTKPGELHKEWCPEDTVGSRYSPIDSVKTASANPTLVPSDTGVYSPLHGIESVSVTRYTILHLTAPFYRFITGCPWCGKRIEGKVEKGEG